MTYQMVNFLRKVFQTSKMLGGQRLPTQFERKAAIRNKTQGSPSSWNKTTRKKKKYGVSWHNTQQLFAEGEVNIVEQSPRRGRGDYSTILTEPEMNNCFSIYTRVDLNRIRKETMKKTIILIQGWIMREHVAVNSRSTTAGSLQYFQTWQIIVLIFL